MQTTPPPAPNDSAGASLDLGAIRQRLAATRGRHYWRSLEELADTEEFRAFLHAEFPREASVFETVGRRQFLQLMGASLAFAGLSACTRQPAEKVVPYVRAPEEIVPGLPLYFATALPLIGGAASGVLVESHMGRPTKVEGNPEHPASGGATDAFAQAAILGLYDPDRSQVVRNVEEIRPWSAFVDAMRVAAEAQRERQGAGLRFLTETVGSPTLTQQLKELMDRFPQARWHQYEPAARDSAHAGARLAFGEDVETVHHFDKADVVLSLDADFLGCGPDSLRAVREFTRRRRVLTGADAARSTMSRLYVVETMPSLTGAKADHRLPLRPTEIEAFARHIAAALGVPVSAPGDAVGPAEWFTAVVQDLQRQRGRGLVVAGEQQPAIVHALAHAMNHALGNVGHTVTYTEPLSVNPAEHFASLRELAADMDAGKVEVLVILGGNPVYDAPVDLRFGERLQKVPLRVHLGLYDDETAELCQWHVPQAHPLEAWSDARSHDGTTTIVQPLIAPLFGGRTAHELLAVLGDRPPRSSHDIVKEYWKTRGWSRAGAADADFESFWRRALHDGLVPGSASAPRNVTLRSFATPAAPAVQAGKLEIVFRPDPTVFDGRFANNGWLQELPKPITKLTWDNAALIAPRTAERLALANGDVVELVYDGRVVRAPVWIVPGHAVDAVTVHLGYGRQRAGRVGNGAGFDAYRLRTSAAPWSAPGLEIRRTGERHLLACTQDHFSMEGRELVRAGTLAEYRERPHFAVEAEPPPPADLTLYADHDYPGNAWGMAIDLNACTGCNACVVACQAENNIPVVGKDQVSRGREMQWIRIDRYFEGDLDNPRTHHQPVLCMHCENAPCEVVCPVNATVHGSEGLNEMVYNRCVGTKYCSNNCPYKVRRFNFYLYSNQTEETLKMAANPDVTVRTRGVMEKCTYCVQRINGARIRAKKEGRAIRDGEVVTACQQVCPAEAIVFGNLNDSTSEVARRKAEPRNYGILAELNTRPRTTYLAPLRNPDPGIPDGERHGERAHEEA